MSKEPLCIKKIIQPCITSLLSLSVSQTDTTDSVEVPFESVKHKKRKRSKKSSEQSDNNPVKRSLKKKPEKMSQPTQTIVKTREEMIPLDNCNNEVEVSPELKELEKRLNTSMLININKSIAEALKPIEDSIDKIVKSSSLIDQQETEIK